MDPFASPPRPPAEAVGLLALAKTRFQDRAACPPLGPGRRPGQRLAQGLHHGGVRAHFDLPALRIARALGAHGAVAVMAAIALDPHVILGGSFVIERPVLRTGPALARRLVVEGLPRAGIVFGGRLFGGRHQHGQPVLGGGG